MGPELIYGLMALIPSILLVIMLLLGGAVDMDHDVDMSGGIDHDVALGESSGPGPLGLKMIFGFIIGFGVGGYLAVRFAWPIHHILSGLIGGAALYLLVYQLLRILYRQQASSQVSAAAVVGQTGTVTTVVAAGSMGEIQVIDPRTGQSFHLRAKALDPAAQFAVGCEVQIKSVSTGLALVEPVSVQP